MAGLFSQLGKLGCAIAFVISNGVMCLAFGAEMEFYLFRLDECGEPTRIPYDHAGCRQRQNCCFTKYKI